MTRAIQPEGWPRPSGYANGIEAEGRIIAIAGQIGWNPITQEIVSDDFMPQVHQALLNIVAVLSAAGAEPKHVVRMTWYVTDRESYLSNVRAVGQAWREVFGLEYPAMSVVIVAGLLEARALVEIEATAVV
jgi:enamine deaminase RidA (YjgF/YER057c/UK114 family)